MGTKKTENKITNNIEIKITSLILAIILWFYALGQQKSEIIFNLPIEVKIKDNMVVYDQSTEFATITLRSQQNIIKGLGKSQFRIEVSLKEDQPGIVNYDLTSRNVIGPKEVEIIDISPKRFSAKIDYLDYKTVPVKVKTEGELPFNYFAEEFFLEPDSVRVEGVKSKIEKLEYIETLPVLIQGAKLSFSNIVRLKKMEEGITVKGKQEVKVTIKVAKEETITLPIQIINNIKSYNVEISPEILELYIYGDIYTIDKLDRKKIVAVLDIKDFKKGVHTLSDKNLKIALPEKIKIKDILPNSIKLTID